MSARREYQPDRVFFLTQTYPAYFPDPHQAKAHLEAFLKRLERRYERFAAVWRIEPQRRGATTLPRASLRRPSPSEAYHRRLWALSWIKATGNGDADRSRTWTARGHTQRAGTPEHLCPPATRRGRL